MSFVKSLIRKNTLISINASYNYLSANFKLSKKDIIKQIINGYKNYKPFNLLTDTDVELASDILSNFENPCIYVANLISDCDEAKNINHFTEWLLNLNQGIKDNKNTGEEKKQQQKIDSTGLDISLINIQKAIFYKLLSEYCNNTFEDNAEFLAIAVYAKLFCENPETCVTLLCEEPLGKNITIFLDINKDLILEKTKKALSDAEMREAVSNGYAIELMYFAVNEPEKLSEKTKEISAWTQNLGITIPREEELGRENLALKLNEFAENYSQKIMKQKFWNKTSLNSSGQPTSKTNNIAPPSDFLFYKNIEGLDVGVQFVYTPRICLCGGKYIASQLNALVSGLNTENKDKGYTSNKDFFIDANDWALKNNISTIDSDALLKASKDLFNVNRDINKLKEDPPISYLLNEVDLFLESFKIHYLTETKNEPFSSPKNYLKSTGLKAFKLLEEYIELHNSSFSIWNLFKFCKHFYKKSDALSEILNKLEFIENDFKKEFFLGDFNYEGNDEFTTFFNYSVCLSNYINALSKTVNLLKEWNRMMGDSRNPDKKSYTRKEINDAFNQYLKAQEEYVVLGKELKILFEKL